MKNFLWVLALSLLWCNIGFAEIIRLEKCHDSDDVSFDYSRYDNRYMVIDLDKKISTMVTIRSDSDLKFLRENAEKFVEENPDYQLITFNKTFTHEEKIIYSDDNIIKTKSVVPKGHMRITSESSVDLKNYTVDQSYETMNTETSKKHVIYPKYKCYHK
jgi:predicted PilT family ATPase